MLTVPGIRDEGALGLAGWSGQSRGMAAAHRHLDLEINYVLAGTMTYLVGGKIVELPLHRLCLLWGGVPHQMLRNTQAAEAIWVTIPLTTVLRWGLPERLIRPLLTTGLLLDNEPHPRDLDLLHQWLEDLPGRGDRQTLVGEAAAAVEIVLLEMEARLRRFARGLARHELREEEESDDKAAHPDRGLAAVEVMAQYLYQNFREDIGVDNIAEASHLHPNYAMTLFRRHTGMTLSQYLTLQRVAYAQRRLATTGDPIQQIALESGFGSVSRFYEAFRQQTGNSPRRFRLQMKANSSA
jgi:AraC-like DNA-binding protein